MTQPAPYTPSYDFSDYQALHPSDPLPAGPLDTEFANIKITTDQVRANLALVQRDDGRLANMVVGPESFAADSLALIGGWVPRGSWVTATVYAYKDIVNQGGDTYICLVAHTSGTFSTDLAANKWMLLVASNSITGALNVPGDFSVATNKFTVAASSGNAAIAGTLGVAGAVALAGTLGVTGAAILNSTLALAGNFNINAGKITVDASNGNFVTLGTMDVAGDFRVATNKFTVAAATGNGSFAGTLAVAGNFAVATNKATINATSGNATFAGTLAVTGAASFGGLITPDSVLGIKGTATNNDAAAGSVGEYLESKITSFTYFPAAATYGDMTSLTLTAGDWDLCLIVGAGLPPGTSLPNGYRIGIGTAAGTDPAGLVFADTSLDLFPPASAYYSSGALPMVRKSIAATTTFYAKIYATYASGSPQFVCRFSARRVR